VTIPSEVQDILEKVSRQKLVLFIGNGASVDAEGPSTEKLVKIIKTRFNKGDYTSDDFIQTCTEVLDTTYASRNDLESLLKNTLYDLKPSKFHLQLPSLMWPAIFTTNYDDLVEKSYHEITNRVQMPDPVFNSTDSLTLHDREKVKIFKLMGCISSQHPGNKLILTREDYNQVIRTRGNLFKALRDIMRDGTILYVGYSFRDYLLQDIFTDLIQSIGLSNLPYSYALMPDIDQTSIQAQKLREKRVVPLSLTATEFSELIQTGVPLKLTPLKDKEDIRVNVKGSLRFIPHRDARTYSQLFEFLSEDVLTTIQPDDDQIRRDFFRGILKDWTGYVKQWDFVRSQYSELIDLVRQELVNPDVGNNKSIMVFGPAGSGKTVLLHRLALDTYKNLSNPVVILRPFYEDIDFKLLSTLCETLSTPEKEAKRKKGSPRARVLLIMESAASHIVDFKAIPTFMKSRGIPVLLVASTRENDWMKACERNFYLTSVENSITLNDKFESSSERSNFISHLKSLKIIGSELTDNYLSDLIQKQYHDSFFASMYSLVEPSRPTLDEKISNEYLNLSSMAQKAYLYIASFYQYSLPLPIELLVRTINCSYEQFLSEIYEAEARKIICEVPAPFESVYFGLRHRIVAERIVEKQIQTMDMLTSIFKELLRNINITNADEVDLCKSLLIRYLGPNGIERRLSPQQIREIFSTAVDDGGIDDPSILHHFGLFESDSQDQVRALELVERALTQVQKQSILPFKKTERIENIFNTLGLIYSRKGQQAELNNDQDSAESYYSIATDYFSKAKGSVSPNAYPYDSESRMHMYRAERTEEPKLKLIRYISALEVIEEAEDNLPEEEMPRFMLLQAKIQEGLKGIGGLSTIITAMQKDSESQSLGYRIAIRLYLLKKTKSIQKLQKAFEIIKASVSSGNVDVSTLRLYTRLFRNIYPDDYQGLYSILRDRYQLPKEKRNLSLLYELGKLAFTFGEYANSREYFAELEKISQGHPKRWNILDKGLDSRGSLAEFSGSVIQISGFSMGIVDIPEIRLRVPFLPYAQKFQPEVGENVTFNIGFNYRGWLAIDLTR
jgi:tetratricopeptide (TPR) repeat protein